MPSLQATYIASGCDGSAITARILLGRWMGEPCWLRDFLALRVLSARESLWVGYQPLISLG